jgi:hypothetical protein
MADGASYCVSVDEIIELLQYFNSISAIFEDYVDTHFIRMMPAIAWILLRLTKKEIEVNFTDHVT